MSAASALRADSRSADEISIDSPAWQRLREMPCPLPYDVVVITARSRAAGSLYIRPGRDWSRRAHATARKRPNIWKIHFCDSAAPPQHRDSRPRRHYRYRIALSLHTHCRKRWGWRFDMLQTKATTFTATFIVSISIACCRLRFMRLPTLKSPLSILRHIFIFRQRDDISSLLLFLLPSSQCYGPGPGLRLFATFDTAAKVFITVTPSSLSCSL